MPLLYIVGLLIVVGVLLWLVNTYIPMMGAMKSLLNLVVIVDRDWKGEIANRLERVGRYQASRTVLCAVSEGRETLDAVARLVAEGALNPCVTATFRRSSIPSWSRACPRCCGHRTAMTRGCAPCSPCST